MKSYLPKCVKKYKLVISTIYSFIFFVIYLIFKMIDFNKYVMIIPLIISSMIILNRVIYILIFDKISLHTYFELNDRYFNNYMTSFYTYTFTKTSINLENIIHYQIQQGSIIMKQFNLFKISISSISEEINLFISGQDIHTIEDTIKEIINQYMIKNEGKNDE